ncbi:hypothetical protein [Micromonospora sp. NPDC005197]|uniref:hypothetical protein n=1 Tax=Micromonospora sp. NPDC005197 TaxID=3157020 RepID=UPI0033B6629A
MKRAQGFSAAVYLTSSGLVVICLSNHTDIAADHVAAAALADLTHDSNVDPGQMLSRALSSRSAPKVTSPGGVDLQAPHITLGTYTCAEVPGSVRLTRCAGSLFLWRRGTLDRLTCTGSTYVADGLTLTLDTSSADEDVPGPNGFVLDLDRAPGLRYRRRPD